MAQSNVTWGGPRIHGELLKLGIEISERIHLSRGKETPEPRPVHPSSMGKVVALPEVDGLHHRYERIAA